MSFRNTFVTDFFYSGDDPAYIPAVTDAFNAHCSVVENHVDERGFGYYSGFIKTSSLGCELSELELESLVSDLSKATRIPFRITVMQESGAVITYPIEPR
jgi:hypothetical protein